MEEKLTIAGENENDPSTDEEPRAVRAAAPAAARNHALSLDRINLIDFQWGVSKVRKNGPLPANLQPQNLKTTHNGQAEDCQPTLRGK